MNGRLLQHVKGVVADAVRGAACIHDPSGALSGLQRGADESEEHWVCRIVNFAPTKPRMGDDALTTGSSLVIPGSGASLSGWENLDAPTEDEPWDSMEHGAITITTVPEQPACSST